MEECTICSENVKRAVVMHPCRHHAMCASCALTFIQKLDPSEMPACPLCRAKVHHIDIPATETPLRSYMLSALSRSGVNIPQYKKMFGLTMFPTACLVAQHAGHLQYMSQMMHGKSSIVIPTTRSTKCFVDQVITVFWRTNPEHQPVGDPAWSFSPSLILAFMSIMTTHVSKNAVFLYMLQRSGAESRWRVMKHDRLTQTPAFFFQRIRSHEHDPSALLHVAEVNTPEQVLVHIRESGGDAAA